MGDRSWVVWVLLLMVAAVAAMHFVILLGPRSRHKKLARTIERERLRKMREGVD